MNKKRSYKTQILSLLLGLLSAPLWADATPYGEYNQEIDPPPTSPIDTYVVVALFLTVAFVGFYFYKSNKISLNNE